MTGKHAGSSSPIIKAIQRWANYGLDEDQVGDRKRSEVIEQVFARDNVAIMPTMCVGGIAILLLLMLSRTQLHGYTALNTVPFLAGMAICAVCGTLSLRIKENPSTRVAISLVDLLICTWYVLAIYANIVLQPEKPSVLMCLIFCAIPLLFDVSPRRMLPMTALALVAAIYSEGVLVPPEVQHTDMNNMIIAVVVGVGCGYMKSAAKVRAAMNLEMFKTATKTTEIVAQVDLRRDTFEALQIPGSIAGSIGECESAREMVHLVGDILIAPDFREEYERFLDFDTLPSRMGEEKQLTFEHCSLDGRWHQTTVVEERRWNGKVSAVVIVARDIDAAKRQELEYRDKLRATMVEAQRANAAKSNFLRRMSHDVRTPINGIRGIVKIGERYPNDTAKQTECRQKVLDASDYLLLLVNNILDMSKLESGEVELEEKPFNIKKVLGDVATISRAQASDHAIRFSLSAPDENIQHPDLIGSPVHFQQILHNLCSNAVKYNRKGGSISLMCRECPADGETVWFHIEVSDTGMGMSEEFLKRAFEPFSQEQQKGGTSTYAGSGLGLSIVKEFAESMGGSIEVASVLGEGTTFTLMLPFKIDRSPVDADALAGKEIDIHGKKALVAEDNALNQEIIEFVLRDQGLVVTMAENGEEALKAFEESKPGTFDVVFMDIMMPVMDGLAATRAIRGLNRPDAKTVPIFAMTANAFRDDMERSYEAGINEHLIKPLEVEQINEALQRWLR